MKSGKKKQDAAGVLKRHAQHRAKGGTVFKEVELIIPGGLKDEPIFYTIIKQFDVVPNIIEASFSTEMGWALVRISAKEKVLEKLFVYLSKKGVRINFR